MPAQILVDGEWVGAGDPDAPPAAHAASHADGGSDEVTLAESQVTGLTAALAAKQPLDADLTALAAAGNSATLAATTAVFETADQTKLDGIETAATADQTAAEILAKLVTVDGSGSGLDADLLDGLSSAAFATAAQGTTADAAVPKALYDANTVLAATTDNTPAAVTMAASTILARLASGDIVAATTTQIRTLLALVIGTNVQAWDADLDALAALTSATNKVPYSTGTQAWALADFTAAGRSMVAAADAAAQTVLLGAEVFKQAQAVNAQTGTTYTLVAGDAGKLVTLSNASAITLTLPQDSDATIAVGAYVDLYQLGAGQVTVAAGTGATLRVSGLTAKARAQYSRLAVQKVSSSTWSLMGDLASS